MFLNGYVDNVEGEFPRYRGHDLMRDGYCKIKMVRARFANNCDVKVGHSSHNVWVSPVKITQIQHDNLICSTLWLTNLCLAIRIFIKI